MPKDLAVIVAIVTVVWAGPVVCLAGYRGEALSFDLGLDGPEPDLSKGFRDKQEMPDEIQTDLTIERMGKLPLKLARQQRMGVPARTMASSDGRSIITEQYDNEDVVFYTDKDRKASIACDLRRNEESGKLQCKTYALISVGEYSCFIGSRAEKADCTPKVSGRRAYYRKSSNNSMDIVNTNVHMSKALKTDPFPLPEPGFKAVEYITVVDRKFMEVFYDRHPEDPAAAQEEVSLYMSLFANEMNVFYDSFKESTKGRFVLYVYPTSVIYPEPGKDFDWSADYNDGEILLATNKMDRALESFVQNVMSETPTDHVMAITAYDLQLKDGDVLGYAYSNTVCDDDVTWKFSIVEFQEIDPAATAAHEIGHALGAPHDEDAGCDPSYNVMTGNTYYPSSTKRDDYFKFSKCSRKTIRAHLRSMPACTEENGFTDEQFEKLFCSGVLGYQENSLDIQCQLRTGYAGSTACRTATKDSDCYKLGKIGCKTEQEDCSVTLGFLWNGTPCGTDMMCFRGRCVSSFDVCPVPVAPCTCCGYKKRKKCCRTGRKMHERQNCYCCKDLRKVEAPEGFDGPRY